MADLFNLETSGLPQELIADLVGARNRKKIAEAMLEQSMGPIQNVGGPGARLHWTQGAAKMLEAYLGNKGMKESEAMQSAASGKLSEGRSSAIDALMKRFYGSPEVGYTDTLGSEPPQGPIQPGVKADPWGAIMEARMSPFLRGEKFVDSMEANLNRTEAREDQQKQRMWELDQQAKAKIEQIRESALQGRITKEEADRRHADLMRELQSSKESLAKALAASRPQPQPTALTDAAGNVTWWLNGQPVGGARGVGKPSATFEKTQAEQKKLAANMDMAISELEVATKDGGLIDQSTGSGFGALVDSAAGFFGKATPGAVASGKMAPIFDMVLKMVPRFEGPQSDKDTQSYKDAAGQLANPAIPTPQKKAAAKEILRLMKKRKGQFAFGDSEPSVNPVFDQADAIIKGSDGGG